jgi:FkbM family methyltransferase
MTNDNSEHGIVETRVPCSRLPNILDKYGVRRIDLLPIDTEGSDYQVVRQLDFTRINSRRQSSSNANSS